MKIGVFDSGLGGLAILREIFRALPEHDYVYLGDNARVPYGGRSPEIIYQFTEKAVDFLFKKQDCALVIIACSTATAVALRRIQREYLPKLQARPVGKFSGRACKRVLGVIRPTVEAVVESNCFRNIQHPTSPIKSGILTSTEGRRKTRGASKSKIGVIATRATVKSRVFVKELKKLAPKIKVYQKACPLLVPIIEEGETKWKGLDLILEKYLSVLKHKNIDSLILGCTHYGLIAGKIKKIMGENVTVISQGKVVAEKLKDYLKKHLEIEKQLSKKGKRAYFVTDLSKRYEKLAKMFLGKYFTKKDKLKLVKI